MKAVNIKNSFFVRLGVVFALVGMAGCSETSQPVKIVPVESYPEPITAIPLENMLIKADSEVSSGHLVKAAEQLKVAAQSYPSDKEPRLKLAQLFFDNGDYAKAIVEAEEALKRDPLDQAADSIVVVSGLRLAISALNDLKKQNHLNGSIGVEAQNLAKLLRASLGEKVLLPASSLLSGKVQNDKAVVKVKEQAQLQKPSISRQPQTVAPLANPKPNSFDPFSSLE